MSKSFHQHNALPTGRVVSAEGINARTSRLNQQFHGKTGTAGWWTHIAREGLLDALLVLYEECSNEQLIRDKHISTFVAKCELNYSI